MMRLRLLGYLTLIAILMSAVVTSLVITSEIIIDDNLEEGTAYPTTVLVETDETFDGTLVYTTTNLGVNASSVPFSASDFETLAVGFRLTSSVELTPTDPGTYIIRLDVLNSTGSVLLTQTESGNVASAAPIITSSSPSGTIVGKSAVLRVTTDRNAQCRFSSSNSSSAFSVTGAKTHEHIFSNIGEGTYIYEVICEKAGRDSETEEVSFIVDYPPRAEIELSEDSPLQNGIIEVTVVTSEALLEEPTLTYSYDDAPETFNTVALTGSGTKWEGYIIINEDERHLVGSFQFEGRDLKGNTGTEITEGDLFIVDTVAPVAPRDLRATSLSSGRIELDWVYNGETPDSFKLYRKTSAGVSNIDFYATLNGTNFRDASVFSDVTYYYRVSVIDSAGNEGSLSNEVFATATGGSSAPTTTEVEEEPPKVLPPNLVPLVDDTIRLVETMRLDVEEAQLQMEQGQTQLQTSLGHASKYASALARLANWRDELDNLKLSFATESEITAKLAPYEADIRELKRNTPRTVQIANEGEFLLPASDNDVKFAIDALDLGLEEREARSFLSQNIDVQDAVTILVSYTAYTEVFLDGTEKAATAVTKTIRHESPTAVEDVLVVENIPTTVIDSATNLRIVTPNYEILGGPVIKWGFASIGFSGEDITYVFPRTVSAEEIRATRTSVVVSPVQLETLQQNNVIGFSIFSQLSNVLGIGETGKQFIKGSLLLILVLGLYYVGSTRVEWVKNIFKKKATPHNLDAARKEVNDMINQCYLLLMRKQYKKACEEYKKITQLYKTLPPRVRSEIAPDCKELHYKLKHHA